MEPDEKLRWLETRIASSMKPRNEDLKNMYLSDENRLAFHEFINNEDVRRLFVYIHPPRQIIASLSPPPMLCSKSTFFVKTNPGVKLTKDNIGEEVVYQDCTDNALFQLDLMTREIYLPLLCSEQRHASSYGLSADKLMDLLHRLMGGVEVTQGHAHGDLILPLPSIEVLADAASTTERHGSVLHVLETTIIGWIKQIKGLIKHDPIQDLAKQSGDHPGPLDEVMLWKTRLEMLKSVNVQLSSPVAVDILKKLEDVNSAYAASFQSVRREIMKAEIDTQENLKFLSTLNGWFEELHFSLDPTRMLKLFPPLVHTLFLVWQHSVYYHQKDKFHNMLRLISNEVVHRAEAMVGEDVLREPLQSYSKLKEALRVCAAFRGTYLDYKDKADTVNDRNKQDHAEKITGTSDDTFTYFTKSVILHSKLGCKPGCRMVHRPKGQYRLFSTKMYGSQAFQPQYGSGTESVDGEQDAAREEQLWRDSPWPRRNAPAFDLLNAFMERCNDVLELVQTTSHFQLLSDAAEVGGAGSHSLDALVKEIHQSYLKAMNEFFSQVTNVLDIDGTQSFETAFFTFRTVVKSLEKRLAEVLRQSFQQCPTIGSQLRLLEVFEGISSRELVQAYLKDKDKMLIEAFKEEVLQVRAMFQAQRKNPPGHKNMPPVISKLIWVHALKERINIPMQKMKKVSPHSLEGDSGWQIRDSFSEAMSDFRGYETKIVNGWKKNITVELSERLKQPLLLAENYDEDEDIRPQAVHVNLDPQLLMLLREIHYMETEPFNLKLPGPARELLRNTNSKDLRTTATRLETITSKYNAVMKSISEYELPLFERNLAKIDHLFQQGLHQYTWKTDESADFIETATALVCIDLHRNLDTVQTNCGTIAELAMSWSSGVYDVFTARDPNKSFSMQEVLEIQKQLHEDFENLVIPSGNRIHALLKDSFQAVGISEASPAWQDYVDYIDAIVLDGLKQTCFKSFKAMLNQLVQSNMDEGTALPILTIRLELIENLVSFRPPLDESTSDVSVIEAVQSWLQKNFNRGLLVEMLGGKGSYKEYLEVDEEILQLLDHTNKIVKDNSEECKRYLETFKGYSFLWEQDVNQTFEEFLVGKISPNPLRSLEKGDERPSRMRMYATSMSGSSKLQAALVHTANLPPKDEHPERRQTILPAAINTDVMSQSTPDMSKHSAWASSAKSSIASHGLIGTAEKSFLKPSAKNVEEDNVPSLDEFDTEINIYRTSRDEISALEDYQDVGWLRVDMKPIKQVLITYASKWMWTFTKYLCDRVSSMLQSLDEFLKRIEPEIESISGEERDTASFMKMMRLFNEVSAKQSEMDGNFAAMHRTVLLVKKYGQRLPESTQKLFDAAPSRWNNLKTKVSLAKQRLGPRIQEESDSITRDLEAFGDRVKSLQRDMDSSNVYSRDCSLGESWVLIKNFVLRLDFLENEAQDLIELQELLEASVVNFSILPQCRYDLNNLKLVWEMVRHLDTQHNEWKRHRWQKMNTAYLQEECNKQLVSIKDLPADVFVWDVYMGIAESISSIKACMPLIDDLSNPAMRTRHWKQLVRVTGGAIQIDNDTLKRMTLGELLSLGLQQHVDDVRAIVQRAVKDLSIEQSLKTYEEVWLSKIFELREHTRSRLMQSTSKTNTAEKEDEPENPEAKSETGESQPAGRGTGSQAASRNQRTASRVSNQSSLSRMRRTSVSSLPVSLLALVDESGVLMLLTNTEPIFDELESHQMALEAMQSSSAAGSFLDEVMKWQKRLQTIEAVLTAWLDVQDKWVELEEVYSSQDVMTVLPNDSNIFATISRDFKLLMRATEKNPNVLQCCQRKNVHKIMSKMNSSLEMCRKSLLVHLERRRQLFPRFYFLSMEDVLHIICNGYDLKQVNFYISKLFENIGCLVYNEVDDEDLKFNFLITGVQSHLGEHLPLKQPVQCEGAIEAWLGTLVSSIKAALQYQLATATGVEKSVETRAIHSAGARKVQLSQEKRSQSRQQQAKEPHNAYVKWWKDERSKTTSRSGSRNASRQQIRPEPSRQRRTAEPRPRATGPRAWILDHVAEVIHLVTQIQMCTQIEETLTELDGGNKEALQTRFDKLNKDIKSTIVMLKGLDDKREIQTRQKSVSESHSGKERSASRTETSSQMGTYRTSNRGSALDLQAAENPPIPEESSTHKEQDSTMEPTTSEPVDTMNLGMIPLVVKKEEESEEEEESDQSDHRLVLFPSQIHKISNLIALLAHQRDLMQRLGQLKEENENGKVAESLEWKSQMQYLFDSESRIVQAKCLDNTFEYGFEYLGSTSREVITPLTERVFLSLIQTVKANQAGLVMGPAGFGKVSTVAELAKSLGKSMYVFNCSKMTDSFLLHDIFKGFAATGCWICFNNIDYIAESVLSVCAQLMATVSSALQAQKGVVNINSEEIQLTQGAAMFSTFDSSIPVRTTDPQKLLQFNSAASELPSNVLRQYRLVSFVSPDIKLMVEISLTSKGFFNAPEIASKVVLLFDMCKQIMGTMAPVSNSAKHIRLESSGTDDGWSPQILKFVIQEAAVVLDNKLTQKLTKQEGDSSARGPDEADDQEQPNNEEPEAEKHEAEAQEKDVGEMLKPEDTLADENESIVIALQNSFMSRLSERNTSVLATLLRDLWPEVDVPMSGGDATYKASDSGSASGESRSSSRPGSKTSQSRAKSRSALEADLPSGRNSFRDHTDPTTPAAVGTLTDRGYLKDETGTQRKEITDAITDATKSLGLITASTFQARVLQLAQLSCAHKTIVVTGPPGCGKSECIKTFALAERERQTNVVVQSIFTKSVESNELLGYLEPNSKEWKEGLLTTLLRKLSVPQNTSGYNPAEQPTMKILQLDGQLDGSQFELMDTMLHNDGFVVLANNEKIIVPECLRFIWETENLSDLSPALLSKVGVVCMSINDVGWRMMLDMWINKHPEEEQEVIQMLCDQYLEKLVSHLDEYTKPPMLGGQNLEGHYKRVIPHSNEAMISTFTTLFEALIAPFSELSEVDLERYFNFALLWSFGGTLDYKDREPFGAWWKSTFNEHVQFPEELNIFDYTLDNDTHDWVKWADLLPAYTGASHTGIPSDAFVHTLTNEQLLYLMGVLTDYGKPVMLIGENGCGKSAIVNERIRAVCSGEVAEVLGLSVNTNRFTNARLLYERLDNLLEWKHGRTYVPKGSKRLLCFVDDVNLAKQHGWQGNEQVDKYSAQTAMEMMRQHIDDGGFYDPESNIWRYVKNVTYVTTLNPNQAEPKTNNRLIRHFAAFGCPYPSHKELETIYSTLLQTHFIRSEASSAGGTLSGSTAHHLGIHDEQNSQEVQCRNQESLDYVRMVMKVEEEAMRHTLSLIVRVTLELQDRLRTMFLPTAERCHYIFTMRDLGNIFRNLCLSLKPSSERNLILQLWQNECEWVYGRRMVSEVDKERFNHAMTTAIRKDFSNPEQIEILSQKEKPIYCNLVEQDSGIVTAGNLVGNQKNTDPTDITSSAVKPMTDVNKVRNLIERAVEEYNKTHPGIKIALYRIAMEQICRLAQLIASPDQGAHVTMVADGSPGRCYALANLAAHLCGYVTYKINPSPVSSPEQYKMDSFKSDLVTAYTRAGVKGERILFLLEEDELLDEDFIVYLTEFIVGADLTHLFTYEEMTTIINSIRTEVTQAGLTYTREVAWDFFINTVRKNFRVCFVANSGGSKFQRRCREYSQFTKHVSFVWFSHWTKLQLIKHAAYHLKSIKWMDKMQRENIAHLLATMHIVLRQQDGQEQGSGQYHHITNTSYEKFVERFITMAESRHKEIHDAHEAHNSMNKQVQTENQLAARLQRTLEHERQVLEERKQGTCNMLSQIGQDKAITEQQVRIVKAQMDKITKLKKLLPEYQVAHERAVYKAIAIVNDTKKVVREIDIESLAELRGMQKPVIDIEDLMAAVIMILKNPQADLTWQKGAKRQMANIERFIEELITFDDNAMPEQTLVLVEPYLKKPSFDLQTMERKSENKACVSLCKWVTGVCKYHRIMISKVKPLHKKVEETTQAIDNAEHKMNVLENKRKALEVRLSEMAKGFEEATIDKNTQEDKTIRMDKQLETAARLRKVLKREQVKIQQVLNSLPQREASVPGSVAMSAAFATYLGPYHYNFRRIMLTFHWPNCLRERGVPLVIDSIDDLKGRVVDWSIHGLRTASGLELDSDLQAGTEDEDGDEATLFDGDDTEIAEAGGAGGDNEAKHEEDAQETKGEEEAKVEEEANEKAIDEGKDGMEKDDSKPEKDDKDNEETEDKEDSADKTQDDEDGNGNGDDGLVKIKEEEGEEEDGENIGELAPSVVTESDEVMPVITSDQYNQYVNSLIKVIVGERTFTDWLQKDLNPRQMENAAMVHSSWQRPALLIDPYREGTNYLNWLCRLTNHRRLVCLDMDTRADPQVIMSIEKCILQGHPLLLGNCSETIDSLVTPIIQHQNTRTEDDQNNSTIDKDGENHMVQFCGRRIICHPDFKLYMATSLPRPNMSPIVSSTTTLVNYGSSDETLVDDLLVRSFAKVRPEMFTERRLAQKSIFQYRTSLYLIVDYIKKRIDMSNTKTDNLFTETDVDIMAELISKRNQMLVKMKDTSLILKDLDMFRDELFPLARRATMLYSVLRSLASIQTEYQFTLPYFLKLFDQAVEGEFPEGYPEDYSLHSSSEDDQNASGRQSKRSSSAVSKPAVTTTDAQDDDIYSRDFETESSKYDEDKYSDDFVDDDDGEEGKEAEEGSKTENTQEKETDESAPTAEDGADGDKTGTTLDLPEIAQLPSDGLEYASLPEERIKDLVDSLTSHVFHWVQQSIAEEHRLLFATLICINIQEESGQHFNEEEISLLLQGNPGLGMQLSLDDFECDDAVPPPWMPSDKWEDVLALSVLPGALDGLCVHVARNSDVWKEWYESEAPEDEILPLPVKEATQETMGEDSEESKDMGSASEFHQLILLRMLRPDRLPKAMARYASTHLGIGSGNNISLDSVLDMASHKHNGIIVLLAKKDSAIPTSVEKNPTEVITKLAKHLNVSLESITVGEGKESAILDAIEVAERNNMWIVVEDINLAQEQFLASLKFYLQRIARTQAVEDKNKPSFRIWLTTHPGAKIPLDLLQSLFILSHDSLQRLLPAAAGNQKAQPDSEGKDVEPMVVFSCGSLENVLFQCIASSIESIPPEAWTKATQQPGKITSALFGTIVVHSIILARQMYGCRGLSQRPPLTEVQLMQAIDILSNQGVTGGEEFNVDSVVKILFENVYGNIICTDWDIKYIQHLVEEIVNGAVNSQDGILRVGNLEVPIPPSDIQPTDCVSWLEEKTGGQLLTLDGLGFHGNVNREWNDALANTFIKQLEGLYESQNMDLGDISADRPKKLDILRLRPILDSVVERLPPLLELGDVPPTVISQQYDFPYHRPSVISLSTVDSSVMPESLGFVLLQECVWFNRILCHIRQNVYDIHQCLLSGPESFPFDLMDVVNALNTELVPVTWIHPNCQPCTHSLASWHDDLIKRQKQFAGWIKAKMIPIFFSGRTTPISHGHLTSLWPGGLVNPGAVFTALKQEKAVISNCHINQVEFVADVSKSFTADSYDIEEEGGMYLRDVYIQGAGWDLENDCIGLNRKDLSKMPSIYIRPVVIDETNKKSGPLYQCPVFMNKARQASPITIPLNTRENSDIWTISGTAMILDPGLPDDYPKKPRNFSSVKAVPLTARLETTMMSGIQTASQPPPSQRQPTLVATEEENVEEQTSTGRTETSTKSQLSYKPMSPQAPPLPLELQMKREKPYLSDSPIARSTPRETPSAQSTPKGTTGQGSQAPSSTRSTPKKSEVDTPAISTSRGSSAQSIPMSTPKSRFTGTPKMLTPQGTPQRGTPVGTPDEGTPSDASATGTPKGTPRKHTPRNTPSGTPASRTPLDTPEKYTPLGTLDKHTPLGTPKESTRNSTPARRSTPRDTPASTARSTPQREHTEDSQQSSPEPSARNIPVRETTGDSSHLTPASTARNTPIRESTRDTRHSTPNSNAEINPLRETTVDSQQQPSPAYSARNTPSQEPKVDSKHSTPASTARSTPLRETTEDPRPASTARNTPLRERSRDSPQSSPKSQRSQRSDRSDRSGNKSYSSMKSKESHATESARQSPASAAASTSKPASQQSSRQSTPKQGSVRKQDGVAKKK